MNDYCFRMSLGMVDHAAKANQYRKNTCEFCKSL